MLIFIAANMHVPYPETRAPALPPARPGPRISAAQRQCLPLTGLEEIGLAICELVKV